VADAAAIVDPHAYQWPKTQKQHHRIMNILVRTPPAVQSSSRTLSLAILAPVMAWSLVACAPMPPDTHASTWSVDRLQWPDLASEPVSVAWWSAWGGPQLQGLMQQALQDHPDLALAQARLAQAQAYTGVVRSAALPSVELEAQQARQRYSENGIFKGTPIAGQTLKESNLTLGIGWTPDLWGEQRAALSAAVGQAKALQAEQALAAQVLSSQILKTAVMLARGLQQADIEEHNVELRKQWRSLISQRRQAGLDTRQDVSDREGDVLAQEVRLEAIKEQISLLRNRLAALCGVSVASIQGYQPTWQDFPQATLPSVVGADLLGRRPDVVAAKWRAQAAQDQIKVAQTQFYPSVHLGLFAGYDAISPEQLIAQGNRQYGVMPALHLPIFEGGRLTAQLNQREAQRQAAVAQYNQTVLSAVRQAADALVAMQSSTQKLELQTQAHGQGLHTWQLTQQRAQAGLVPRMSVLATQIKLGELKLGLVDLQAQQLTSQIELSLALGGGWSEPNTQP
jgi:NodT family efflux transporter outer membrane factor (OMF) lipoprotein